VTSVPARFSDPKTSGLKYSIAATTKDLEIKLEEAGP
jgi:hypothetical protein